MVTSNYDIVNKQTHLEPCAKKCEYECMCVFLDLFIGGLNNVSNIMI